MVDEKNQIRGKIRDVSRIIAWAMYDTANQFFVLNIISLYFVRWVTLEKGYPEIFYSIAFGVSTAFVAVISPLAGTVADLLRKHNPALVFFTLLSIIFTFLLGLSNSVFWSLVFFGVANYGCQQATIFYNALMLEICPEGRAGLISGLGKMFGYLGALIALFLTQPVMEKYGYPGMFFSTAGLFLVFSLPCLWFIKDRKPKTRVEALPRLDKTMATAVFLRLKEVLFGDSKIPGLRDFLKAAFFGVSAINVVMLFMAVYGTKVFALNETEIIKFVAFGSVFALVGSISSGMISDWFGYQRTLSGVFWGWAICLFGAGVVSAPYHWLVGALAGTCLGATWVVARAMVLRIVPKDQAAEAFGFFNLVGYAAGIIGPLYWGAILLVLQPLGVLGYRLAMLSLIPFVLIGLMFLRRVPIAEK